MSLTPCLSHHPTPASMNFEMSTAQLAPADCSRVVGTCPATCGCSKPSGRFVLAWTHRVSTDGIPGGSFFSMEEAVASIPTFLAMLLEHCPSETSVRAILSGSVVVTAR